MKIYKKAILPSGFKANGTACGIKRSKKPDLALFFSEIPAKASCKFTANKITAAPVKIDQRHLKVNAKFKAVIANSGNANCFTGNAGLKDAEETVSALALALGVPKKSILVASTGIIGRRLQVERIKKAIPHLAAGLSFKGIDKAKKAIITTDTFSKEITVKFRIGSQVITVCGVAKGAGMISPNMATMLCFIFTDALISQRALDKALTLGVERSFDCITVDGCMSTNDSVILLANGMAKNDPVDLNKHFNTFANALAKVCLELARMIIIDAEGATKFIRIRVSGAKNFSEARKAALSIANSNLFKTAMYGENPNFGRIVAALGASGVEVKEKDLRIVLGPLNKKEIDVGVSLKRGIFSATVYTSDLTPEYIKINAAYS